MLAVIDTPELDQQITQARADLSAAVAAQKLSAVTAARWRRPACARTRWRARTWTSRTPIWPPRPRRSNPRRPIWIGCWPTKQFAHIAAPFDGVVTARNLPISGPWSALVQRQSAVHGLGHPCPAAVCGCAPVLQRPDRAGHDRLPDRAGISGPDFPARLSSSSGAISSQSSTMLVQFEARQQRRSAEAGRMCAKSVWACPAMRTCCACPPAR